MDKRFDEKVAIITGGSSGIGRTAALIFARDGAKVVVAARRIKEGEETVTMIKEAGGEAIFVQTDISIVSQIKDLVSKTMATYGRLDYACNIAGVPGVPAPLVEKTEAHWDQIININLKGTWACMKYQILAMLEHGGGAIVNMSSFLGLRAFDVGLSIYIASKHGIIGLTKAAAVEYAPKNIRVNVICPAYIETPMTGFLETDPNFKALVVSQHPIGRIGTSEEVANAAAWLCSNEASFITGHTMLVDGGYTAQ